MSKSEKYLLDSSVAIALFAEGHVHWKRTNRFLEDCDIILCPVTQGAISRVFMRESTFADFKAVVEFFSHLSRQPWYQFIADDVDFKDLPNEGIFGHRQVTDAYLPQLARKHGVKLATLDEAQAVHHADVAVLIPVIDP